MTRGVAAVSLLLCCAVPAVAQVGGTTNGTPVAGEGLASLKNQPGMPPTYPQMRNTGHRGGEAANAATAGATVAGTHDKQPQLWPETKRNSSAAAEDARRGANSLR